MIRDPSGSLFGTAGGGAGGGVVYKLDASGQETVLYSFTGGADGYGPNAIIRDSAGNFYGTTYAGGKHSTGVVFKLKPLFVGQAVPRAFLQPSGVAGHALLIRYTGAASSVTLAMLAAWADAVSNRSSGGVYWDHTKG